MEVKDSLDFAEFSCWNGGSPNEDFLEWTDIWCNLSTMFYEFILSNNSSCEHSTIKKISTPLYVSWYKPWNCRVYSLLKLLKAFYWPFKRHTYLESSAPRNGQQVRREQVTMHWNVGLVEARHHHRHLVFSDQHSLSIGFTWKCDTTLSKMCFLECFVANTIPSRQNMHDHVYILLQIKGWFGLS